MNHSHSFWLHVAEMKPNYKADELWLKQNWWTIG
jgi:predicted metal-dependent hydrolase